MTDRFWAVSWLKGGQLSACHRRGSGSSSVGLRHSPVVQENLSHTNPLILTKEDARKAWGGGGGGGGGEKGEGGGRKKRGKKKKKKKK